MQDSFAYESLSLLLDTLTLFEAKVNLAWPTNNRRRKHLWGRFVSPVALNFYFPNLSTPLIRNDLKAHKIIFSLDLRNLWIASLITQAPYKALRNSKQFQ